MNKWYAKLERKGFSTVLGTFYSKSEADNFVADLNEQYQTDEYFVEAYDPDKTSPFRTEI